MKALQPSETSGNIRQMARRHIPEDLNLQDHRCENVKYHIFLLKWKILDGISTPIIIENCPNDQKI
jgi:hypothetical protein